MLSPAQKQAYREQGFLVLQNRVEETWLERIDKALGEFESIAAGMTESDERIDLEASHSAQSPRIRRVKLPHRQIEACAELMRDDCILQPVRDLLGPNLRLHTSKLNFKSAGYGAAVEWHQDWAFYPHTNDDLLAVGVMLEDCTADNGPLMVIPGSHRGPVYDHHHDNLFAGGVREEAIAELLDQAVDITAPAGSISLHHVRTLHASRNNRADSLRPLLLFSYAAVDAFPVFERYDIDEFDSRILRGEPVRAGRMEALPFRIQVPRRVGNDSIFDDQESMQR